MFDSDEIREMHARLDAAIGDWLREYAEGGGRIYCGRGCRNCCRLAVHATLPEAVEIARALTPEMDAALAAYVERLRDGLAEATDLKTYLRRHRQCAGFCPFLTAAGECAVYEARPFACRSLLSTRNPDYCGIDLASLHPLEQQAFLSGLDAAVVAYPTHYAAAPQAWGLGMENAVLKAMQGRFGFTLSGNLPYLVWLEREHALSAEALRGGPALAAQLKSAGLAHPVLLDLRF